MGPGEGVGVYAVVNDCGQDGRIERSRKLCGHHKWMIPRLKSPQMITMELVGYKSFRQLQRSRIY
jgi:hypothetical protein